MAVGKSEKYAELCCVVDKQKEKMRRFLIIMVAVVAILATGGCIAIGANTLGSIVAMCCVAGVVTALCCIALKKLWVKMTQTSKPWVNLCVEAIVMFPIVLCTLLGVNYFGADDSTRHTENAVIERLYSKTRHHTKRVSRRTVGVGEEYKVYYAEVRMTGVARKEISLNQKQWHRLHRGDTIKLQVAQGALGLPVIKRKGVPMVVPQSHYRY